MSAAAVRAPAEFLRWTVHALDAGAPATVDWDAREEGLVQVLVGAAEATSGGERLACDTATVVWVRGARRLTLAASAPASVLTIRADAPGDPAFALVRWADLPPESLNDALSGRSIAGGALSAWRFDVAGGYYVDDLNHREEQISAPLDGTFDMLVDGGREPLTPGAVAFVPGRLRHGGDFARGRVALLEVFCPKRQSAATVVLKEERP